MRGYLITIMLIIASITGMMTTVKADELELGVFDEKADRAISRRISLFATSEFHKRINDITLGINGALCVNYTGVLGNRRSRFGGVSDGSFLGWEIREADERWKLQRFVLSFSISDKKQKDSVAHFDVDGIRLYVLIGEIRDGKSIDKKLESLHGLSVREMFNRLETKGDDMR